MDDLGYLQDVVRQLRKYRALAEAAIEQIDDDAFFAVASGESTSVAIIMKHLAGNMRSRWTRFLESDGEKPDRDRDGEFVIASDESRSDIEAAWAAGWARALETIDSLAPADLERSVRIRGEPHTALQAINRQVTHYAYHVGQIVLLCRRAVGPAWRWLSIPPGKSREYDVTKDGSVYEPES